MRHTNAEETLKWVNELVVKAGTGEDVRQSAQLVQLEILNGIYRQLETIAQMLEEKEATLRFR